MSLLEEEVEQASGGVSAERRYQTGFFGAAYWIRARWSHRFLAGPHNPGLPSDPQVLPRQG